MRSRLVPLSLAILALVALVMLATLDRQPGMDAAADPGSVTSSDAIAAASGSSAPERTDAGNVPQQPLEPVAGVTLTVVTRRVDRNEAVLGAEIEAARGNDVRRGRAVPEAEGRYELELAPGDWLLRTRAEGYQLDERTVTVGAEATTVHLELVPTGMTRLHARTADGATLGEAAAALDVTVYELVDVHTALWWSRDGTELSRSLVGPRKLDEGPRFHLALALAEQGDLLGLLHHADPRGTWLSLTVGSRSGEWVFVRADQADAELRVDLAREEFIHPTVVMRVVDLGSSGPPPLTQVWLEPIEARRGETEPLDVGPDGLVRIERVFPGEYMLIVSAPERAELHRIVRAQLGRDLDLGTLRMERALELVVVVRDGEGRPLSAHVSASSFEPGSLKPLGSQPREVLTAADGSARLQVSSGPTVVRARVTGPARVSPLTGHDAAPRLVEAPRPGQLVELVVQPPAEVGVSGAYGRVAIIDEQGIVVDGTWEIGAFWGGYLQPGRYRALDVTLEGQAITERAFEVRAGQTLEFALH